MKSRFSQTNLNPRHLEILELTRRNGFLSTEELSKLLKVTVQTIRRDINELCEKRLLRRYHGGAGLISSTENVAYSTRRVLNHEAKIRIARVAADFIPDNASLFINIGTTTEEVAKALRNHRKLRVITNNLNVAGQLCGNAEFEVIVTGGVVRADRGVIGESTIDFVRQFKVDYGIIGISGIDDDGTLLDFDYREVRVAQAIIENARHVLLVADHTKFGCNPMVRLGNISEIDAFFTDRSPSDGFQEVLDKGGVALYVCGAETREEAQAATD
ncbi:MAG: DeoR family transcriptional regulator [Candidatus Accumulibacter sp.]|jgi:DeoR family glycerol-3-phosphate regulon repressor|nr:DeoR family transcriptional regulator [Accumulibacter sp.]